MSVVREGFGIGGAGVDGSYAAGVVVLLGGRAARAPRVLFGGRAARAAGVMVLLRASRPRSQGVVWWASRARCWSGGFAWRAGRPRSQGVVWWASWACCWCGGTVAGEAARALCVVICFAGRATRAPSGCFCRKRAMPAIAGLQ